MNEVKVSEKELKERAHKHAKILIDLYHSKQSCTLKDVAFISGWSESTVRKDLRSGRLSWLTQRKVDKIIKYNADAAFERMKARRKA